MWLIEQNGRRINRHRLEQLAKTGASVVGSACPYCLIMLGDALKELKDSPPSGACEGGSQPDECRDVAELLAEACGLSDRLKTTS